jgi:hypothetical protein
MNTPLPMGVPPQPPRFQFRLVQLLAVPVGIAIVGGAASILGLPGGLLSGLLLWVGLLFWLRFSRLAIALNAGCLFVCFFLILPVGLFISAVRVFPQTLLCSHNLKQIAGALELYHLKYGSYPPAYLADAKGKPIHSWRVLILPYLGQTALYDRYRFDEPWDGPHNRLLHRNSVSEYRCPVTSPGSVPTDTSYMVVVGPQTAWPGARGTQRAEITDGLDQTLLVVEVRNSGVHWMEPRDLDFAHLPLAINPGSGRGISGSHAGAVHAVTADKTVVTLRETLPADIIRALLTIRGGEHLEATVDGGWKLVGPQSPPVTAKPAAK